MKIVVQGVIVKLPAWKSICLTILVSKWHVVWQGDLDTRRFGICRSDYVDN